jgi:type IV pilus assembly protein PilQ
VSQFAKLSRRFAGTGAAFMLFAHMTLAAESADSIVAPLPPLPASFEAQPVDQPVPDAPVVQNADAAAPAKPAAEAG